MSTASSLLGDDGRGYDLARRLDLAGAWREWFGDAAYTAFSPFLASPSSWDAFMVPSPIRSHLHLQLRARALLFDKASVALFLSGGAGRDLASLNPNFLRLHGDDVYFTLEDVASDGVRRQDGAAASNQSMSKAQSRQSLNKSRTNGHLQDQKHRQDELLELWYDRFIEKHRTSLQQKYPSRENEPLKRTPEGMAMYLKQLDRHKRQRRAFEENQAEDNTSSVTDNGSQTYRDTAKDENLFPEDMFPENCVPDIAIPPPGLLESNQKIDIYGVLDSLPHLVRPSPAVIERFGIMPELRVEFGRSKLEGRDGWEDTRKSLSQQQASQMGQKVVAQALTSVGFDGSTEVSVDVFSQFLGNRLSKLGCILKLLNDSYRKQFSSTKLIKMFLKTTGHGNIGTLSDYLKDSSRVVSHQNQQQAQPFQVQHQGQLVPAHQQVQQRLMQPQMNALHPQHLLYKQQQQQIQQQQQMQQQQQQQQQQQLMSHQQQQQQQQQQLMSHQQQQQQQQQLNQHQQQQQQQQLIQQQQQQLMQQHHHFLQQQLRRRQVSNARISGIVENDRPLAEVKIENMSEPPLDGSFSTLNRQQLQFRHQQIPMANTHAQHAGGNQFKQFSSLQANKLQTQGSFNTRSQPMKVEGFQELMGGDSTMKHDNDGKLTSPSK